MTSADSQKWDFRFLDLAKFVGSWSLDPSTQVGAAITNGRRIISVGYNGLPQNVIDSIDRLENRDIKLKMIVHAERNAIIFAQRCLVGCTLYVWPFMPCAACSGMIIQAGIKRVVAPICVNSRWEEDFKISNIMFSEANVKLDLVDFKVVDK